MSNLTKMDKGMYYYYSLASLLRNGGWSGQRMRGVWALNEVGLGKELGSWEKNGGVWAKSKGRWQGPACSGDACARRLASQGILIFSRLAAPPAN